MSQHISPTQKAYIAGFLDGDGSIYVRMKPNKEYRFGFQIAPHIVFFQSKKEKLNFERLCSIINLGYMRERKDGILEYTISRKENILRLLEIISPYVIMKKKQVALMRKIIGKKEQVKSKKDFNELAELIDRFRELNYSKKRKRYILTP